MAWSSVGATVPPVRFVPFAVALLAVGVTSGLLLPAEFEYESAPPFAADEIERDLLFDGRSWSFDGHDVLDGAGGYYRTDVNLAALRPISATPPFTLDPSYISPAEVIPARAKRAHRMGGRKRGVKQRKREQHSYEELDDDDDEAGKEKKSSQEEVADVAEGGVEEYAARYEKFIAEHFDDVERRREKSSARQRKAPTNDEEGDGRAEGDDDDDDDDEGDDAEAKDTDGDYKFDRFDYSSSDDYERIKAESEEQSRRLAKDPRNCRTYEKDGMVCSVCHDPASDSASESCAYATEPHHRKYAYVKERNYDSKQPEGGKADQELMEEDDEEEREQSAESRPERQAYGDEKMPKATTTTTTITSIPRGRKAHPIRKPMLRSKPHQLATNGGGYRYQPPAIDLRSNRATSMKLRSATTDAAGIDGQPADDPNVYVMDYSDQDDVARVLADFKSRDWSNCRKGKRTGDDGGLTCYQCQDAAGVKHEECMYVSESRQVATGIALPPAATAPNSAGEGKQRKRKKVVPLRKAPMVNRAAAIRDASLEPQSSAAGDVVPAKEKQTVKRTVSFRSFVTGRGQPTFFPLASDASERVIHYEHHVSHEVP